MPRPSLQSEKSSDNYLHRITAEARRVKASHPECIIMTLGEPEYPPPNYIIGALTDSLKRELDPDRVVPIVLGACNTLDHGCSISPNLLTNSPLTNKEGVFNRVRPLVQAVIKEYEEEVGCGALVDWRADMFARRIVDGLSSLVSPQVVDSICFGLEQELSKNMLAMTRYMPVAGLPQLREAYSSYLERLSGVRYNPETEILITDGGKEALALAAYVACDPGNPVYTPLPYWSGYNGMEILSRTKLRGIEGGEASFEANLESKVKGELLAREFLLSPRRYKTAKRLASLLGTSARDPPGSLGCLLINSPNNPSGKMIEHPETILAFAKKYEMMIISDDVYHSFVFDGQKNPFLNSLPGAKDSVLVVNSVSKSFSMTGFRVGCLAGPQEYIQAATNAHSGIVTCLPGFVQMAAKRALESSPEELEWVAKRVNEYQRRRDIMHEGLGPQYGKSVRPQGTFFYWLDVSAFSFNAEAFAKQLLEEELVAVAPGNAFGDSTHVRLSLTVPGDDVRRAVERLNRFATKYCR